ncbi:ribonuclease P protein component [Anthocerotibacter panamensis]|uniref:ribonuclease P protein component n=1 Tax=Anthocerotibacter panamensis TaxID=2857077 RepID=UPI001C403345|nr:ribonuclease P protein component [Anthocerotibacter panamensis]
MLPKPCRLRQHRQFEEIYRKGRRVRSPLMTLYYLPNRTEQTQVGIVTSRKVGIAVVRNRLRRLVREVLRERWPALRPGFNLVVVLQSTAVGATLGEIDQQLGSLLERAEVAGGYSGRSHF